jgi:hypothetical protein
MLIENNIKDVFDVHGSVHRNNILLYIQQRCNVTQFVLPGNCYTCFGCYHHPSSGARNNYLQHLVFFTLKPVPTLPR